MADLSGARFYAWARDESAFTPKSVEADFSKLTGRLLKNGGRIDGTIVKIYDGAGCQSR